MIVLYICGQFAKSSSQIDLLSGHRSRDLCSLWLGLCFDWGRDFTLAAGLPLACQWSYVHEFGGSIANESRTASRIRRIRVNFSRSLGPKYERQDCKRIGTGTGCGSERELEITARLASVAKRSWPAEIRPLACIGSNE